MVPFYSISRATHPDGLCLLIATHLTTTSSTDTGLPNSPLATTSSRPTDFPGCAALEWLERRAFLPLAIARFTASAHRYAASHWAASPPSLADHFDVDFANQAK
jgi:hypothetical protein